MISIVNNLQHYIEKYSTIIPFRGSNSESNNDERENENLFSYAESKQNNCVFN